MKTQRAFVCCVIAGVPACFTGFIGSVLSKSILPPYGAGVWSIVIPACFVFLATFMSGWVWSWFRDEYGPSS